ncbi:MAG: Ldh family oxidoreductase [Alphaproteobacteria bacterium]|nr:Ldh family oxidoreductase [Alphaproteobacteria bacterium]
MSGVVVSADLLRRQLSLIFAAWGMPANHIADTVHVMVETDLRGIDSHGVGMMPSYDRWLRQKRIVMVPTIRIIRDLPSLALIDGGGGLGYPPSVQAMTMAIAKAKTTGIAAVGVRRTDHFGAAGHYALMAAAAGLVGMAFTAGATAFNVPTFGREPRLGTNPIAFAAPGRRNRPFCLDMATTAIAFGKVSVARRAGKNLADGLALDEAGRTITDAEQAFAARRLAPLGGDRARGGHKGYGLAMMVQILCDTLSGTGMMRGGPGRVEADMGPGRFAHFFLALDPAALRGDDSFGDDLDELLDLMRATAPIDPAQPVLVAGDPEDAAYATRSRNGIPMTAALYEEVRAVARHANAEFVLGR